MRRTRLESLIETAEDHALWEGGRGTEWQNGAIVGAGFLRALVELAAEAPMFRVRAFCEEYGEDV